MRNPSRRTLLAGVAAMLAAPPVLAQTATKQKVAAALPRIEDVRAAGHRQEARARTVDRRRSSRRSRLPQGLRRAPGRPARSGRRRHGVPARLGLQAALLDRRVGAGERRQGLVGQPYPRYRSRALPSRTSSQRPPSRSATCSPIAAGCPAMSATTSRSWASPRARSCSGCASRSRPTASATATRTATSA